MKRAPRGGMSKPKTKKTKEFPKEQIKACGEEIERALIDLCTTQTKNVSADSAPEKNL
jgi:hypothetical protein